MIRLVVRSLGANGIPDPHECIELALTGDFMVSHLFNRQLAEGRLARTDYNMYRKYSGHLGLYVLRWQRQKPC